MADTNRSIFQDIAGKRWRWLTRIGMVIAMIISVLVIVVSFSVMLLPVASINAAYRARPLSFQPKKRANAEQEYASLHYS